MPTKFISKALLGVLSAGLLAVPAFAGNCFGGSCETPVHVLPSYAPEFGPMTIRNENPLGHLRSVNFQRAPNVSITRIHSLGPTASLSDAPSSFTGGCHPSSTTYCRQNAGVSGLTQPLAPIFQAPTFQAAPALQAPFFQAPVFQAPVFQAPVPQAPVIQAPVIQAPAAPVVVRTGGGYDASKFAARTYGDAALVPGVAYLPTSRVVRDTTAAQQVLDSGQTRPQDVVVPGTGTAPHLGMIAQTSGIQQTFGTTQFNGGQFTGGQFSGSQFSGGQFSGTQFGGGGFVLAPTRRGPSFGQPGAPILQQSGPLAGSYGSSVAADGTYWEKVSGPTSFGNTQATQVLCKRQLPQQTVHPMIGVPVPVATQHGCQNVSLPTGVYGQNGLGRWIR